MTNSQTATTRSKGTKVTFRADIQGMRALAVIVIIAYHAGLDLYPGGFVTLDVFFVISGFLITFLLLKEIRRTGTLSLRTFYQRRARRILPAATVTALGTLVASWLWLSLIAAEEAAYDAVWAAIFAANIRFAMEETDYFALGEAPSPFQHYWSLSVEEQFYVGLPLLLLGCVAYTLKQSARSGTSRDPMRTIAVAIAITTALSFVWSVYAASVSPETAYFSTFTRVWEFGVGALLAIVGPKYAGPLTARARNLLAFLGLAAIVVSCFVITPETGFPGYAALAPVLGTAAIIFAGAELGERSTPVAQRMLGCSPLRLIGDASYSLYLWHWPIITIATQYVGRDLSNRGMVMAIVVTFAVSFASYYWVETPLRRGLPRRWGDGLVLYPATVTMVCAASVIFTLTTHAEIEDGGGAITTEQFAVAPDGGRLADNPVVARVQASARAATEGAEVPADLDPPLLELEDDNASLGDCDYDAPPWEKLCARGDADADRTMVVLGNSHGRHWIPALDKIAERAGYTAHYLVKSQCPAVRADVLRVGESDVWKECEDFNAWAQSQIEELEPDVVVISTTAGSGVRVDGERVTDPDVMVPEIRDGFVRLIEDVQPHAGRVAVLGDIPRRGNRIDECLSQRGVDLGDCAGPPDARHGKFTDASRDAAEETGAQYVNTWPWFCADEVCPPVVESTVPYRDRNHMTTVYAEELAEPLGRALRMWPR